MLKKYAEWIEKASDYRIIDDRALILLGDSAEILSDNKVKDFRVITDPPYDFDANGGAKLFNRDTRSAFHDMREKGLADGFNPMVLKELSSADSMIVFMHNDQIFKILQLLTQPYKSGTITIPKRGEEIHEFKMNDALYDRFVFCNWKKDNPMPVANKNYVPDVEVYIHVWRLGLFAVAGELHEKSRIINHPVGKSPFDHPTVKPQKIMRKCVTNASNVGDDIIDPFAGTGSTGVASLALGRQFVGIEKDPAYFKILEDRLAIASGKYHPDEGDQRSLFNAES